MTDTNQGSDLRSSLDQASHAATAISAGAGSLMGLVTSPLRSKLFLLALTATIAGGGMLAKAAINHEPAPPGWASFAFRVGASFVAAFIFAYLVRRTIVLSLLIGGGLVAIAITLNKLGIGITDSDLKELNEQVHKTAETIQTSADSAWAYIKTYLPSGGAAGFGFLRGVRHAPAKPNLAASPPAA